MKLRLFKKQVNQIEVGNLVNVKNYVPGGMNMLVSLVPDLSPISTVNDKKGKSFNIRSMICTAVIDADSKLVEKLSDHIETLIKANPSSKTYYDDFLTRKIILVSREFMKLPNKQQLALLNIENEKGLGGLAEGHANALEYPYTKSNIESQLSAEVATIAAFGKGPFRRATMKNYRLTRRSEFKATKGLHRYLKKNANKVVESVLDIVEDEIAATKEESGNVKSKIKESLKTSKEFSAVENLVGSEA